MIYLQGKGVLITGLQCGTLVHLAKDFNPLLFNDQLQDKGVFTTGLQCGTLVHLAIDCNLLLFNGLPPGQRCPYYWITVRDTYPFGHGL